MGHLLTLHNVSFVRNQQTILDKVSFGIKPQEITTLIGPNGAGKTSLARLLLGLETPSAGHIQRETKLTIGYVPQILTTAQSLPLTVERFLKAGRIANKSEHLQVLERVNAKSLFKKNLYNLSGGERQRVLLARALLGTPNLLVLDEPMQGVDIQGQAELYSLLHEIQNDFNLGIFLISHDLHIVMSDTNKIICLNKHICCSGASEKVMQDPAFLKLFGLDSAAHIGIYKHRHDHSHGFTKNNNTKDKHA